MLLLAFTIVALCVFNAEGCSKKKPPPPPPPPNAPPAPPVPPPIVKVVRQQEQFVGFNKCYRHCGGALVPIGADGKPLVLNAESTCVAPEQKPVPAVNNIILEVDSGDATARDNQGRECVGKSECKYICKFKVYTEVALTTISKPTGCGCAFHINMVNPRPARVVTSQVRSAYVANKVDVGDFKLVVWDYKANRVVERVPEFKLSKSQKTKDAIAKQIKAQSTADFTSVTAGYAGQVTRFPKLPESLDLNKAKNKNNVPALEFEITQEYDDIKTWDPPRKPQLEDMPNAYQSQCVPYWPKNPFCYNSRKRQANKACGTSTTPYYHKKFLLFPKSGRISGALGTKYTSRLITSFYTDDECTVDHGFFSVDSEFETTLKATSEGASLALGTWSWERQFNDGANGANYGTHYVLAVPGRFSGIKEVWDKGYSTIDWHATTGYEAFDATTNDKKLIKSGICSQFKPAGNPQVRAKYGEKAKWYKPQAGIKCTFDPLQQKNSANCGTKAFPDKSLMAFLNEGEILNFNKGPESELIMGRMNSVCNTQPYKEVVFDTLTFTGVPPGRRPKSRIRNRALHDDRPHLGLVYDDDLEGFVHFLHPAAKQTLAAPHKRSVADALQNQVATPPNEENLDMRVATGSTDDAGADSANAGDHPLDLWTETFSAPVNIDPAANAPPIVEAVVTTGSARPNCNRGSIGCSCRVTGARECDIGLECDDSAKCMLANCKPGQPGCPCNNNACDGDNECKAGTCATKSSCSVGEPGCECAAGDKCNNSSCTEGVCIVDAGCTEGSPGCVCDINNECAGSLQCNKALAVCLAPRCKSGAPGCRCKIDGSCQPGFACDRKIGACGLVQCPAGEPGCQCTEQGGCTKQGFKCIAYSSTGDRRCVAEPDYNCGNNQPNCVAKCGSGNIAVCPPCTNGLIVCRDVPAEFGPCRTDPFGEACQVWKAENNSNIVSIAFAAIFVAVAMLF